MARGETTSIKTITRLERLSNSRNGNPRYRLHFDDATSALTQTDSACAYELQNIACIGVRMELTLTRAGRVCGAKRAEVRPMNHGQALGYLESAVELFLRGQSNRAGLEHSLRSMRAGVEAYMTETCG